jgi:hypothetical protein
MPKSSNRRKSVSSKNILKKMKDLSEYYKKKILKGGGEGDDATNVAQVAQEGAERAQAIATQASNAAASSDNPFDSSSLIAGIGASQAPGASSASMNRVERAASSAAPPAEKPWYQFWGGKSNKRRRNRNRNRKQTNKKRN